jgi:hypothetical protein
MRCALPDIPAAALAAAEAAVERAAAEFGDDGEVYGQPREFARACITDIERCAAGRRGEEVTDDR